MQEPRHHTKISEFRKKAVEIFNERNINIPDTNPKIFELKKEIELQKIEIELRDKQLQENATKKSNCFDEIKEEDPDFNYFDEYLRLNRAVNSVSESVWEWDLVNKKTYFDNNIYKILGYKYGEIFLTPETWTKLTHPEDVNQATKAVTDAIKNGTSYEEEFRALSKNNEWIWIKSKGKVTKFNDEGKPTLLTGTFIDITKRKNSELALKRIEKIFNSFLEHSPIYVFFKDEEIKSLYLSNNYEKLLNKPLNELIGKNMMELFPSDFAKKMIEDDISILKGNKEVVIEEEFDGKYFRTIKFPIDITIDQKYLAGYTIDITQQKKAENELKYSEQRFRALIQNNQEIIFIIDKDGIFTLSEGKGLEKLSLKPGQVVGQSVFELYKDFPDLLAAIKDTLNGNTNHFEATVGDHVFESWYSPYLDEKGNIIGLLGLSVNTTEQNKIKDQLRYEIKQWDATFNAIADSISIIDLNGNFIKCNDATFSLLNVDENEIKSKPCHELVHGTKCPHENCPLTRMKESKKHESMIFETNNTWLEVSVDPIFDNKNKLTGAVHIVSNITNRKIREDLLKESQERFDLAMNATKDGVYDWNLETNEIYFSPGWKKMLGYNNDELPNEFSVWETLTEENDVKKSWKMLEELIEKKRDRFELEFKMKHKNGSWVEILSRADAVFNEQGKAIRVVGTHVDITERKKNEQELKLAKEKAEENNNLKSAFLANMSHEIRTPMNAVLGFSQLLVSKKSTDKEKEQYAQFVRINGDSLLNIIDDIIDISKIHSKQLEIKKNDFNLHILLKELKEFYTRYIKQKIKKHLTLILDISTKIEEDFYINTDEKRLKQILNNLISNAIKYSEKGTITFGYTLKNEQLHFFVKDMGYGISKKNIGRIFDRFVQVSKEYASKEEGTGLGLPISKNLVNLLGGKMHVESVEFEGSTFSFNIPLVKAKAVKEIKEKPLPDNMKDLSKFKVLIADDEDSNYVLTKRILKETRVYTDWATNGNHAIEMATNNNYDLIIMDVKMPGINGIEATKKIKEVKPDIPILIQTAFAISDIKKQALAAGCDDFVEKPITLKEFLKMVNKYLIK